MKSYKLMSKTELYNEWIKAEREKEYVKDKLYSEIIKLKDRKVELCNKIDEMREQYITSVDKLERENDYLKGWNETFQHAIETLKNENDKLKKQLVNEYMSKSLIEKYKLENAMKLGEYYRKKVIENGETIESLLEYKKSVNKQIRYLSDILSLNSIELEHVQNFIKLMIEENENEIA